MPAHHELVASVAQESPGPPGFVIVVYMKILPRLRRSLADTADASLSLEHRFIFSQGQPVGITKVPFPLAQVE